MNIDRTVKWIDKTDGRDKFCKAIQYACRIIKHKLHQRGQLETAKKFDSLFGNMRDARKLFRLFKTVNQFKKIQDLMKSEMTLDNILSILVRFFFGVYWIFDNLNILSKVKILSYDPKKMGKTGAMFWLLALLTNLILLIKQFIANAEKIGSMSKYGSTSENEVKEKSKELKGLLAKKKGLILNIVKVVGDIIPSGQASEVLPNVLGINANDSWCGMGGLVSALLTSYQLYD